MSGKAWGGRFQQATDRSVELFTESISLDQRLWRADIAGSQAHARMLAAQSIISPDEAEKIALGLQRIAERLERGEMEFKPELEDIHMHIESALIEALGDAGRKLHTARSRNDQVATALRLWVRGSIDELDAKLVAVQKALVAAARRQRDIVMPAYTHWQRAQPVLAGHYYLAYVERFARDRERLADCRKRVNRLPLGCAALAGTSLPIDREHVAKTLGFDGVTANSLDTSGDRDFALEFCFVLAAAAGHLAGWAEEWIIFNTTEFGFIALPDAYCTGSSIMPQKKNPDVLELIRGKTAHVVGALSTMLALTRSLPIAYNRDLQEDKTPLFTAYDVTAACLEMAALIVDGARLVPERVSARLDDGYMDATSLMEGLIAQQVPMRQAHEVVGKLVSLAEQRATTLAALSDAELVAAGVPDAKSVRAALGVANAVRRMRSYGSTAPDQVEAQLAAWERRLA